MFNRFFSVDNCIILYLKSVHVSIVREFCFSLLLIMVFRNNSPTHWPSYHICSVDVFVFLERPGAVSLTVFNATNSTNHNSKTKNTMLSKNLFYTGCIIMFKYSKYTKYFSREIAHKNDKIQVTNDMSNVFHNLLPFHSIANFFPLIARML